jgi:hypothetical protein
LSGWIKLEAAMPLTRLICFSENQLVPGTKSVLATLGDILSKSNRNNKPLDLTGALVFDNQWFVQVLEGERASVWTTFERIRDDERHDNVVIAEFVEIEQRSFATWWMGLATRHAKTEHLFEGLAAQGRFDPRQMTAAQLLTLTTALAQVGLARQLGSAV